MNLIFSQLLFTCFILALYFVAVMLKKKEMKYTENRLFTVLCLCSAIWSLGFFGVSVQTIPDKAYVWRGLGMIGTFGFLITAQFLICYLSGLKKIYCYFAEGFSCLGCIIYFFVIQKEQVTYKLSEIGMTYSFNSGLWNNLYILYSIVVALNMFFVIIYMLRYSTTQRLKELGKKLLITELIVIFGMLFDTIFPLVGKTAIPGSTLAQFIALAVMYNAIIFVSHSRITISNMSEFIYYSLTVPVLVYDARHQLQILNDTAYSFLGVDKDNLENAKIEQLFSFDRQDVFQFEAKSQEIDAICCHNQLYCSLSINKIHDDYGDIIGHIIIVTDLSDRMKTMKELEDAMRDAEYANQAKSTFLANMSHEIRTPMNAIIGFSELILKMNIDEQVRRHVEDIKWSSHNLLAIINDILDISKIESGKMEIVSSDYFTGNLLNDVALIIEPQAEKKELAFHMQVDETIPRELYGDKVRIRGILINILNNAVKYTQKGSVAFEVSVVDRTEKHVKLAFKISDTGIGIRQESMKDLFKNFERLDQKIHYGIEGSGLGLAIANGYVALMGGEIQVSSTYGEGSAFTVILEQEIVDDTPLEKNFSQERNLHKNEISSELKIKGLQVLVTDDNQINLRVAHGILSYYGLLVDTATGGREAIAMCQAKKYDFVFMDQMMPEIDGIEAMHQIRGINAHYALGGACKMIVLTADAIKGTREHLMEAGFDEYLGKPINIKQLERLFLRFIPDDHISYEIPDPDAESIQQESDSADIGYLVETLSQVNVENGIANCGGNLQDYLAVLKIAYEYGEKQLLELEDAWHRKDYEFYIIKIHSLKSTSLNLGAAGISAEAKKQEEEGRAGNVAYIDTHMEAFQKEYRMLLENIKLVLKQYQLLPTQTKALPLLEEEMILPVLKNVERCIEDFDFSKVFEILEEMKKYRLPEKYEAIFAKTASLMEDLSVDEIMELLHTHI